MKLLSRAGHNRKRGYLMIIFRFSTSILKLPNMLALSLERYSVKAMVSGFSVNTNCVIPCRDVKTG